MPGENRKELYEKSKKFFSNKKVQWAITAVLLLVIIFTSTSMRLSNLPLLVDSTTGNYSLSDPDALYWLRLEQHLLQYGNLSGIDTMRNIPLNVSYTQSLLVYTIVDAYKIINAFNPSITINLVDAAYPAYAFLAGLIIFFFLVYVLTKSKTAAVLASAFLAYSPAFLFRTISGVSGHEALGTTFLFAAFLSFVLGLKNFHKNWKNTIIWGILTGLLIGITFASWNGTTNFMFLTIPLTLVLFYLFHLRGEEDNKAKQKFIMFYLLWVIVSLLSTYLFNLRPSNLYPALFSASGFLVPTILLFFIVDYVLSFYERVKKSKFSLLISFVATLVVGILGIEIFSGKGFGLFANIYNSLIHPLGTSRIGLTVAYFAQPYLVDFQSTVSLVFFWLFVIGMGIVWIEFIKGVKSMKHKIYLALGGFASIFGLLFSRYSAGSALDGVNFLSQAIYILSFVILIIALIWIYKRERHKIDSSIIFIFSWMMVMLITVRAAQRTIFLIVPFMALAGAFLITKMASYTNKAKGHDRIYLTGAILILSIVLSFIYLFGNPITQTPGSYLLSYSESSQIGPLLNNQWENAMAWVRNNTAPGSIFSAWWDYGYLIQTIGLRPTVLDGGNYNGYWDHLMGRYVLTTQNPNTAFAFWKAQNVSYFLIDFTDFGKYPAFSIIGSDSSGIDRYAAPAIVVANPSLDYGSPNSSTIRIFQGVTFVDSDISYNGNFIPGPTSVNGQASPNAYFIGTTLQYVKTNDSVTVQGVNGVYSYKGKQYTIPIRYAYYNGKMVDFGTGIDAVFMIVPNINIDSQGRVQVEPLGSGIYLSPKVQKSLYAQIYLLNDYNKLYPTLTPVNVQENSLIMALAARGVVVGKFAYYQGSLLAPIEIWKVNYPSNILTLPQFTKPSGQYADLDNLTLTT